MIDTRGSPDTNTSISILSIWADIGKYSTLDETDMQIPALGAPNSAEALNN